jgi:uncharacterized protein
MAPKKTTPLPKEAIESQRGITFSFALMEQEPDIPTSDEEMKQFDLESVVHKITSTSLLQRMGSAEKSDVESPKRGQKRRKITQSTTVPGECQWCNTKKTAQWRRGPNGSRSLCNVHV